MSISKPLVIPFHGSYWYFRDPAKRPSSEAHIMRGLPTKVAILSTDGLQPQERVLKISLSVGGILSMSGIRNGVLDPVIVPLDLALEVPRAREWLRRAFPHAPYPR
jgi:hypothetical protein